MNFKFNGNKYGARKTEVEGIRFDSKAESQRYVELKYMVKCKMITCLTLQPKCYMTKAKLLFKPDFLYIEGGVSIYEDVKGVPTPVFNIKKRLWKHYGKGVLRITKKKGRGFEIVEEIISKEEE